MLHYCYIIQFPYLHYYIPLSVRQEISPLLQRRMLFLEYPLVGPATMSYPTEDIRVRILAFEPKKIRVKKAKPGLKSGIYLAFLILA